MRNRKPRTLAVAVVGAALIAAGCSNSAAQPTPAPTTEPTAAATTTAPTPSDTAIDQAKQTITAYFRVYDQLGQKPAGADPAVISTVAAGKEVAGLNTIVQALLKRGIHIVGDTSITRWTVHDANIAQADAEVAADVCYDVSKAQVVDAQGAAQPRETMQAGAPDGSDTIITVPWRDQRLARFIVHNSSWPDPAGWRVTGAEMRNAPCD